jgi:hypothetical protein
MAKRTPDPVVVLTQSVPISETFTKARRKAFRERHTGALVDFRADERPFGKARIAAVTFVPRRLRCLPPTEVELVVDVVSAPSEARRAMGLGG